MFGRDDKDEMMDKKMPKRGKKKRGGKKRMKGRGKGGR
jgi:hypothetical protein